MTKQTKLIISIMLVALGVACRLLPHLWNFAPVAAIALFSGVYLGRRYALVLPLLIMLAGDLFIGFYALPLMVAVYGSYALIGLGGTILAKYKSLETVMAGSIVASAVFFVATNFAVWQFSSWYTKDIVGLISCFTAALPFFRSTLLGDLFYTSVFFGAYEAVKIWSRNKKLALNLEKI